jgi:hypothetical protein
MLNFKRFLVELSTPIEEIQWEDKSLFHGTSLAIAKNILDTKVMKDSTGVNEIGSGFYVHPSMNRTSPWVHSAKKDKEGAFIEFIFNKPLKLAILKRGIDKSELKEKGFDGVYDKNGITQVPHQILIFNDNASKLIDWNKTKIIPFDDNKHGYLEASDKELQYYEG